MISDEMKNLPKKIYLNIYIVIWNTESINEKPQHINNDNIKINMKWKTGTIHQQKKHNSWVVLNDHTTKQTDCRSQILASTVYVVYYCVFR